MLSNPTTTSTPTPSIASLNAPFGARFFLTQKKAKHQRPDAEVLMHLMALGAFSRSPWVTRSHSSRTHLNAPYGARCVLTRHRMGVGRPPRSVLMHLMVLGAF